MSDLASFPGPTTADMSPEKVLAAAVGKINPAIVVGFDQGGKLYVASSIGDSDRAIALLARAQVWLCNQADAE
ncbi:hypothetical protein [Methylobacterium sp. JK268]